jgi:hypothetical protein
MIIPTPQPRDDGPPFQPQAPVRWFNPAVLARPGLRVLLAAAFGTFLDKRELQSGFDSGVIEGHEQQQELWLDYIADTGDGFDATYTIA